MRVRTRPERISTTLNSLDIDGEMRTELEAYIADLEAKQPIRPIRIAKILEVVNSQFSGEADASLESYISKLEANQQTVSKAPTSTKSLYWRSVRRQEERKARAQKKQNDFQ